MRYCLISLILSTAYAVCFSQVKLSGYVFDAATGQPLDYAAVYEVFNKKGVITAENGYFELLLKKTGALTVEITHVNYQKASYRFHITCDTILVLEAIEKANHLQEISISARGNRQLENTSSIILQPQQVRNLPSLGSEKDVLKALQYTPGVLSGNEGNIGLNVRGGSSDQNLFLIDNMPVYSPSHLFGFFSTFNPDIIGQTELVRAGLPANYGGKLASVVDIRTKKVSNTECTRGYSVGLISAKYHIEIPIVKNKSGLMLSARRSYFDLLLSAAQVGQSNKELQKVSFYDFNIKYEHNLNPNNIISVHYLQSKDVFYQKLSTAYSSARDLSGIDWKNMAGFVNYKHIGQSGNVLSLLGGISNYNYNFINENYGNQGLENSYKKATGLNDFVFKLEYDFNPLPDINLIVGAAHTFHRIIPLRMYILKTLFRSETELANESALFVQANYTFPNRDVISVGVRQSAYIQNTASYFPLEPRLNYTKKWEHDMELKASVSRNVQFIHRVEDLSAGLPTERWCASTALLKPEDSYQLSVEVTRRVKKIQLGGAVYYKWMNNLVEHGNYYADFPMPESVQYELVESGGKGQAFGLECYASKQQGAFNYTVSYLLSKSIRKFESINNRQWYPANFDRRHNLNTTLAYNLKNKVLFSAAWVFSSGQPVTIPEGKYDFPNVDEYDFPLYYTNKRNTYRLAPYHRLDLSVQFKKIRQFGVRIWEISIYNAYNRKNPYAINLEERVETDGTKKIAIIQYSLFPLIPSVSYIRQF